MTRIGNRLAVVVLAAGQGKRMHSATPKVLHPVLGEPMLGHVLRTAAALEPDRLVVVTGHGREIVDPWVAKFANDNPELWKNGAEPRCVLQPSPNGTGHAMLCAQAGWEDCDEVVVLYGDVPLLRAETVQNLRVARGDGLLSLLVADQADPTGYGRVVLDLGGRIAKVVEHKDASEVERRITLSNAGMMSVRQDFLLTGLQRLTPDNAQGELYLTDLLHFAAETGQPAAACRVVDASEVQGVNQRAELALVTRHLRERINRAWMLQGVTFEEPETTLVEPQVVLAPDVTLAGGVELRGKTRIAAGASIDRGAVLRDVEIGPGAHVLAYTVASEASVGPQASVGPFAHLRPGTVLEDKVKVGNFVETKKARLGRGAKASHLSYLGDADIGPDCNIGAGTITCNYDGVNKHKTVLGRGVFIGSDTQLVAPVTLGEEAYVGAGTTVTEDVPAGALAVSRAPQRNIEGWVQKKKARQAQEKAARQSQSGTSAPVAAE